MWNRHSRCSSAASSRDAYCMPCDTGDHPLISKSLPGCPYRMTSYSEEDIADVDPAFEVQLHHPRFLECIGAPESARLLGRAPEYWIRSMTRQDAMAAALQLQRDAGSMASNIQVLGPYVKLLNRMSSEVMRLAFGPELFPSEAVDVLAPIPRVHRTAQHMSAMGLWRPPTSPGVPGPMPASSYDNDLNGATCQRKKSM